MSISPYTIAVPQADLDDLRDRLARVRWTDELPGAGTDYGVPLDYVKRLVQYWQNDYDWRTWEARLNAYPQFTTTIDGQNIHFLHVRSSEPDARPLILTHGWPTSVVDYLDLIGPLTDPRSHGGNPGDAFHVVIPSLPGFGFSGPTNEKGWNQYRIARAWIELMHRLGYTRYCVHGNDWGSIISPEIGRFDPEGVVGVHVTQIFAFFEEDLEKLSEEERERIRLQQWWEEHLGIYHKLQSNIPQTLAHALADSPVGLLAWIGQMFATHAVSDDYVLTTIMIYWLTRTAASSMRLYYEDNHATDAPTEPTTIPLGLSNFANDYHSVRLFAERLHKNIIAWNRHDRGGHFVTETAPDLLLSDIRAFFKKVH